MQNFWVFSDFWLETEKGGENEYSDKHGYIDHVSMTMTMTLSMHDGWSWPS